MSETTPTWQISRYGVSETLNLGVIRVTITRPIGTQGMPSPPLYVMVGEHRLNREFENINEAKAYALHHAVVFLERALRRARLLTQPTPTNPNRSEER